MLKLLKSSAVLLACVMMAALAAPKLHGADAPAKGSIKGVVYDADHHPVANVAVRLMAAADLPQHKAPKPNAANPGDAGSPAPHPTPVASTTSDSQGAFTFPDVAAGEYGVVAALKGSGHGMEKVTVSAGATANCDITLKAHAAKKPV